MNAFVFDAWGLFWCSADLTYCEDQQRLYSQVKAILEGLDPPLQRGAKLDHTFPDDVTPMYCVSFSATYVLGLWLSAETNEFLMRRSVADALPNIETMTLSLPPPDGSGGSSGAQHGHA
ncbi:MAG: hypothetical protein KC731_37320 [Myxococcales bacterium]|nr:hypothetical protein [Myxococcales bacterium]